MIFIAKTGNNNNNDWDNDIVDICYALRSSGVGGERDDVADDAFIGGVLKTCGSWIGVVIVAVLFFNSLYILLRLA